VTFGGIRLYITLGTQFQNKVRGLGGTFNYQTQDDFLAANNILEMNLVQFADSYKIDHTVGTPAQTDPCDSSVIQISRFLSYIIIY
jgi:hypothetical protein